MREIHSAAVSEMIPLAELSDHDVVERAQRNEEEAVSVLVSRFQDLAIGFAYLKLGNRDDAEDVVQTAWLKALRSLHCFRGEGKFSTWLCSIVLNECRQLYKHRRTWQTVSLDAKLESGYGDPDLRQFSTKPQEPVDSVWIRQTIQRLPAMYRHALTLRYVAGLPLRQVAATLNVSKPAAKSRIMRAQIELRSQLTGPARQGRLRN